MTLHYHLHKLAPHRIQVLGFSKQALQLEDQVFSIFQSIGELVAGQLDLTIADSNSLAHHAHKYLLLLLGQRKIFQEHLRLIIIVKVVKVTPIQLEMIHTNLKDSLEISGVGSQMRMKELAAAAKTSSKFKI